MWRFIELLMLCVRRSKEQATLCTPPLTFDKGIVTAPVKEYASRRRSTTVDLVSLNDRRQEKITLVD